MFNAALHLFGYETCSCMYEPQHERERNRRRHREINFGQFLHVKQHNSSVIVMTRFCAWCGGKHFINYI